MSFLQRLWLRAGPTLESIELGAPPRASSPEGPGVAGEETIRQEGSASFETGEQMPIRPESERSVVARWFFNDMFFIAMLLLALAGVILRLPVTYWIVLTPIFGLISIIEGWSHFSTRSERLGLAYRVAAIWAALLVAIYLLYDSGVQGVLNANGTSLAMIILLALGTFVAGIQARVWQICAVGGLLFLSVPGLGWLDQSPLLLAAATVLVIGVGGLVWWVSQTRSAPASDRVSSGMIAPDISLNK